MKVKTHKRFTYISTEYALKQENAFQLACGIKKKIQWRQRRSGGGEAEGTRRP
jgi:hypothetical protein